ncbi:MAG: hypothetical protein DWH91_01985 [Planctomycetota bacterium]|nr:MAG: hypothetical protein DWH91_01985 [Planctomycetota bacterium]
MTHHHAKTLAVPSVRPWYPLITPVDEPSPTRYRFIFDSREQFQKGSQARQAGMPAPRDQRHRHSCLYDQKATSKSALMIWCETVVAFRSAKDRSFAERKATIRKDVSNQIYEEDR